MDRSLRFFVVVLILLAIGGGVLVVLLNQLEQVSGTRDDAVPILANPVHDLEVGDWTEYVASGGKHEVRVVVFGTPRTYVYSVLTSSILADGSVVGHGVGNPRTKWDLGLGSHFNARSYRPEAITVAGREWNSWRVEHDSATHGILNSWISDEVPLGLLRQEVVRVMERPGGEPNYVYVKHGKAPPATPKAGDWAEYDAGAGTTERHEVTAMGSGRFRLTVTTTAADGSTSTRVVDRPLGTWNCGLDEEWKIRSFQAVSLTVAGEERETARIEFVKDNGPDRKAGRLICWLASDMPLGLLRRRTIEGPEGEGPADLEYGKHGSKD